MTNQETLLRFNRVNECLAIINQKLEVVEKEGKLILELVNIINKKYKGEK